MEIKELERRLDEVAESVETTRLKIQRIHELVAQMRFERHKRWCQMCGFETSQEDICPRCDLPMAVGGTDAE